jgi:hypothetical protein
MRIAAVELRKMSKNRINLKLEEDQVKRKRKRCSKALLTPTKSNSMID